jgi:hypothetical protein
LATLRIFGFSLAVTVVSLVVAYLYGGPTALFLVIVLSILEVSLSFDNAVLNATILQRMSRFWQRIFLTVGILIAVFGMRLIFPLLMVWATARIDPVQALRLALNPPANGALEFPDGSPSYEKLITAAHPQIAAFGGMFLLMLFSDFVFADRDIKWLRWLEVPLARIGRLDQLSVVVSSGALIATATLLTATADALATVMIAGVLGILTYLVINGLGGLFHPPRHNGPGELAKATGRAGFFLFLYLEVLDATFSFDGVIGAFAITVDPIIIALGLGLVGAMFVRSITIYLVRKGTLHRYVYLEHGAHWAIGALAVILLVSIGYHVPVVLTGLVGVALIGAAFVSSVLRSPAGSATGGSTNPLPPTSRPEALDSG